MGFIIWLIRFLRLRHLVHLGSRSARVPSPNIVSNRMSGPLVADWIAGLFNAYRVVRRGRLSITWRYPLSQSRCRTFSTVLGSRLHSLAIVARAGQTSKVASLGTLASISKTILSTAVTPAMFHT